MNLNKLSTVELRLVKDAVQSLIFDHPQMKNIAALVEEMKKKLEADPDRKEAERLLAIAETHGLDAGYADPADYYFFVKEEDIKGEKHIELLLCLKFEWFFNGQTYNHEKSMWPRNFHRWVPNLDSFYDGYEFTCKPKDLRAALLKAGLEEKPELERFYDELCAETEKARKERMSRMSS